MSFSAESRHAKRMGEREASAKPVLTLGRGWAIHVGTVEPTDGHLPTLC